MGRHKNSKQEAVLVHFMKMHPNLAFGKMLHQELRNKLWKTLAVMLNSHGPPKKSPGRWKKVWLDWRTSVKRKVLYDAIEAAVALDVDGQPCKKPLTQAEQDIATLCGYFKATEEVDCSDFNSDLQEDLSTSMSDDGEEKCADGDDIVSNIVKEEIILSNEQNYDEFGESENEIAVQRSNKKDSDKVKEAEHLRFFQTTLEPQPSTSIPRIEIKTESESYEENNGTTKKRPRLSDPSREKEAEANRQGSAVDLANVFKQQSKVCNAVTRFIDQGSNLHQQNLQVLKEIQKGLKDMCAAINQLVGATDEQLKEQRRHNYEMEKLRREEILLQRQQLQLEELAAFDKV